MDDSRVSEFAKSVMPDLASHPKHSQCLWKCISTDVDDEWELFAPWWDAGILVSTASLRRPQLLAEDIHRQAGILVPRTFSRWWIGADVITEQGWRHEAGMLELLFGCEGGSLI